MKRLVLAASLLVGSCSEPVVSDGTVHLPAAASYDLWLDPSLSQASIEAAQIAVHQWATFTDVQITLHWGVRVCADDCFSIHEIDQATLDKVTDGNYVGYTIPGFIFLAGGLKPAEVDETAIHEVGHALGLVHHPAPAYAVMAPGYGEGAYHVACDDVAQYYAVRNVSVPSSGITPCTDASGPL